MPVTPLTTPKAEIDIRINQLKSHLEKKKLDAALIVQKSDLFYFAGTIQQSHLYVPVDGDAILMTHKDFERARSESSIDQVIPLTSPKKLPDLLRENGYPLPGSLGMELDVIPANLFLNYQKIFPESEITDISPSIREVRAVKSTYEIGLITAAAEFSDLVAESVLEFLREGMTEIELAGLVESRARKLGHQGVIRMRLWGSEMFYGHLMAGPSAAVPSFLASPTGGASVGPAVAQGPSFQKIKRYQPVLVDYVFAHQGYLSDHTRIFALKSLPDDLLNAHRAMLNLQTEIKKTALPGVAAGDVYDKAVQIATELGYADNFMGVGDRRIRFVGHGIGIELDEYPFLAKGQTQKLQEGMIIALEPKLIFPGQGVVGIENTHVVTAGGLHQLGKFNEEINIV